MHAFIAACRYCQCTWICRAVSAFAFAFFPLFNLLARLLATDASIACCCMYPLHLIFTYFVCVDIYVYVCAACSL